LSQTAVGPPFSGSTISPHSIAVSQHSPEGDEKGKGILLCAFQLRLDTNQCSPEPGSTSRLRLCHCRGVQQNVPEDHSSARTRSCPTRTDWHRFALIMELFEEEAVGKKRTAGGTNGLIAGWTFVTGAAQTRAHCVGNNGQILRPNSLGQATLTPKFAQILQCKIGVSMKVK
jgi:hypothetical protein